MGRARADEERVDDDVAPVGQVQQRVLDHRGRLDGRMVLDRGGRRSQARRRRDSPFERQRPRLPSSTLLTCGAEPFLNTGSNSCWDR